MDIQTLEKIYIEPTNTCNLNCSTCIRNIWDEPDSFMSKVTFVNILKHINEISPIPSVFFGGYGEPLNHPDIFEMINKLKNNNIKVELITNGILLTKKVAELLIDIGLDRIWVSIDGSTPENYLDIRLGSNLPLILSHLKTLQRLKDIKKSVSPGLGVAFVALKRNIYELPKVMDIAVDIGADEFSISNVLPYTPELNRQILYENFIGSSNFMQNNSNSIIPPMEIDTATLDLINNKTKKFSGKNCSDASLNYNIEKCPFIDKKSTSIRSDGSLSPCLPLMHRHKIFIENNYRIIEPYTVGNINQKTLLQVWNDFNYIEHRKCIADFDFFCSSCTACFYDDFNNFDCFSNGSVCGGCLWAMGLIRCP